jgi:hypothetical protein
MKIYRRSKSKITADMDILHFINMQRRHNASLYGLMTKNQRKFSEALSMQILSEFSSDQTEDDTTKYNNQTVPFSEPPEDAHAYIDEMFQDPDETDLRYLTLYNNIDTKRKNRWK